MRDKMKKKNQGWFPKNRAKQLLMFTNMKAKIVDYKTVLPLANEKVARIILICDTFIAIYNYVEQTRATTQLLTDYQDLILTADGGTAGALAPAVPVFQTLTLPPDAFVGIFGEFQKLVDDIKHADGYTHGIGEDLMIVAPEGSEMVLDELIAGIKAEPLAGMKKVRISGSLQGMSAIQVQYQPKGTGAVQNFFLTKLPADITIASAAPDQPENGFIRAVLIENNQPVGQFSPDYPVTIS
jgi:hypothetical protein